MREIRQASGHLSNKGVPKGAYYSEGRESVEPLSIMNLLWFAIASVCVVWVITIRSAILSFDRIGKSASSWTNIMIECFRKWVFGK